MKIKIKKKTIDVLVLFYNCIKNARAIFEKITFCDKIKEN